MRADQILRSLRKRLRACRIKRQVHGVVLRRITCAIHGYARDVLTRDDRRIRSGLDLQVLRLAGRQCVAEAVRDGAFLAVFVFFDLLNDAGICERIQACEFQLAGLSNGLQRRFGVCHAGDLHQDLVVALHLHGCLGSAQRINAVLNDGPALLQVLLADGAVIGIRLGCGQHHGQAALDIQTLIDLLVGRHEHPDGADDQQRGSDEQPDVAAIHVVGTLAGILLPLAVVLAGCLLRSALRNVFLGARAFGRSLAVFRAGLRLFPIAALSAACFLAGLRRNGLQVGLFGLIVFRLLLEHEPYPFC